MILILKNAETGKIANWKLSTKSSIYCEAAYRFKAIDLLKIMVGSKIKYNEGPIVPGYKYPPILLKPKQIKFALDDINDRGEPGGIKALRKALEELQEEVEELPPLPSD